MLIPSNLGNASKRAQVYKRWKGGAGHVWRRTISPAECGTVGKYDVERDTSIMITSG